MNAINPQPNCQSEHIAAYLDGELDAVVCALLEEHLKLCPACSAELAEQRSLLCTLDSTFGRGSNLPLPTDFARVVAARAESDMSGVRDRREHTLALRLCLGLAIAGFSLLGVASSKVVLGFGKRVIGLVPGVFDLAWNTLYDGVEGLTIIFRMLGKGFIPGSLLAGSIAFLLVGFIFLVLSRLIANYHRTRLID